ncbi:MAG: HAD family hydrolase [Gomphosphaeria aponina SAG 52.96 = DSM 107014]|uniref:HAD family hydrolase n=1 Tax=Gomphosphaeria aponina SAG 52.96 = DSM 107014 TaxID=1521640 RepID=A0A941GS46_9CHRO|nr:HAD family hydrolase [Gomphosphaeria aponina SAG 52.96 = DSM 107014]
MFIPPKILALDFDGVLCDGIIEYFQTTKLAYAQIWDNSATDDLATSFYKLRPVIETGWEMPVLLRALVLGINEAKILENWHLVAEEIVISEQLEPKELAHQLDTVRDQWIESDLDSWLGLHRFYPGVVTRVSEIINSPTQLYIVTTKEGRFVKQLLHNFGIQLPQELIIGKECKRPKHQTLRELMAGGGVTSENVWFVEDRLKTLTSVQQQPDLPGMGLYLAAWGYNTQQTRDSVSYDESIKLLSLEQFNQDFAAWVEK